MTYTAESHIKTVSDVKTFFHHLANECRISFHPDDDFAEYTYNDNIRIFSDEEAVIYNRLMDESLDVCEKAKVEIYGIGYEELIKAMNFTS